MASLPIVSEGWLRENVRETEALASAKIAFTALGKNTLAQPPVQQLIIPGKGETCIKSAHLIGQPYGVVKVKLSLPLSVLLIVCFYFLLSHFSIFPFFFSSHIFEMQIASGFPGNVAQGIPSGSGMMVSLAFTSPRLTSSLHSLPTLLVFFLLSLSLSLFLSLLSLSFER